MSRTWAGAVCSLRCGAHGPVRLPSAVLCMNALKEHVHFSGDVSVCNQRMWTWALFEILNLRVPQNTVHVHMEHCKLHWLTNIFFAKWCQYQWRFKQLFERVLLTSQYRFWGKNSHICMQMFILSSCKVFRICVISSCFWLKGSMHYFW